MGVLATWSLPLASTNLVLSNGNLTVAGAGAGSSAEKFSISRWGLTTGKVYWESTLLPTLGGGDVAGITNILAAGTAYTYLLSDNDAIYNESSGSPQGTLSAGAFVGGAVLYFAYDIGNALIWISSSGNSAGWNGSGTANPATGAGGLAVGAVGFPYGQIRTTSNTTEGQTANFGASAFAGTMPTGFESVNTALSAANPFLLPLSVSLDLTLNAILTPLLGHNP